MAFWDPLGLYSRSCYNCVFFLKERSTFQCLFPAFQRCSLLHKWHFGGTTVNPELQLLPTWERSRSTALPLPAPRLFGLEWVGGCPWSSGLGCAGDFPGTSAPVPRTCPFHLASPMFPAPGGSRHPPTHPKDGESFIPLIVGGGRSGCFCDLLWFWGAGWGGTACAPAFLLVGLSSAFGLLRPGQPWGPASGCVDAGAHG